MTSSHANSFRRDAKVIGLVGFAHGTSHFFHLAIAPLFPWLKADFAVSYAELGLLMTVFFVVSGIGQALAGFVVDRIGAVPVLFSGIALLGISALGLAASQSYPMLIFFAGVMGLGNCVFHPADFTLLNRRVSVPRLGHAFSMHGLCGTLGWALAPVFLVSIASLASWRIALMGAAILAFASLALLFAFRHLLDPRDVRDSLTGPAKAAGPAGLLGFMKAPGVWMCFIFFLISSISFGGIQSFAPAALRDIYGVTLAIATGCITAYMLGSAGGIIAGGFLAAKTTHHERVIAVSFSIAGALAIVVASGTVPTGMLIVLLGVIGFGTGIANPSRDLLIRGAAPKGATGRVYGVVYSGLDVGIAIAPTMFGMMMDAHHPDWVFVGIGLAQILALFAAIGVGGRVLARRTAEAT
jgi:MFS transporter, FSR family, fosmidomycin resistance protein